MFSLKQLKATGHEMQAVMKIKDPYKFDPDLSAQKMVEWIRSAIEIIDPKLDHFTPEAQAIIDELKLNKEAQTEEPEEVQEIVEEVPVNDDLQSEIKAAERLRDLKDIAAEYPEFKVIRGKVSSYKSVEELRTAMLDALVLPGVKVVDVPVEETPKATMIVVTEEDPEMDVTPEPEKPAKPKKEKTADSSDLKQADVIRELLSDGQSREDVIKAMAVKFGKTETEAKARLKIYEKKYGEMGANDKKVTR